MFIYQQRERCLCLILNFCSSFFSRNIFFSQNVCLLFAIKQLDCPSILSIYLLSLMTFLFYFYSFNYREMKSLNKKMFSIYIYVYIISYTLIIMRDLKIFPSTTPNYYRIHRIQNQTHGSNICLLHQSTYFLDDLRIKNNLNLFLRNINNS